MLVAVPQAVIVTDYDPSWPAVFEQLRTLISARLGELAVAVEHVGSTAVPGLAAKPIIDLDVVIPDRTALPAVITGLEAIGYRHEGDLDVPGREAFTPPPELPDHHLYVCALNAEALRHHLAFRDYLRAHPGEPRSYGAAKREAARRHADDRAGYIDAKHDVVVALLERGLNWQSAAASGHAASDQASDSS